MNDSDQRRYDALGRAQTFGRENGADFAEGGEAKTRFANIGKVIKKIDDAKAGRAAGSGNASKVTLINALRIDCANIRRTAVAMAQDEPGFAEDFPALDHSAASVLTTADAYLAKLEPQPEEDANKKEARVARVAQFVRHELPADFVSDLRENRDAIGAAAGEQEAKRQGTVGDTTVIDQELTVGFKELRYLNAIMHNKYSRVPEKLRAWKSATHIERAPQRAKKNGKAAGGSSGGGNGSASPPAPQP